MYEKPTLVQYGSFRELTRGGQWAWDIDTAGGIFDTLFHDTPTTS